MQNVTVEYVYTWYLAYALIRSLLTRKYQALPSRDWGVTRVFCASNDFYARFVSCCLASRQPRETQQGTIFPQKLPTLPQTLTKAKWVDCQSLPKQHTDVPKSLRLFLHTMEPLLYAQSLVKFRREKSWLSLNNHYTHVLSYLRNRSYVRDPLSHGHEQNLLRSVLFILFLRTSFFAGIIIITTATGGHCQTRNVNMSRNKLLGVELSVQLTCVDRTSV